MAMLNNQMVHVLLILKLSKAGQKKISVKRPSAGFKDTILKYNCVYTYCGRYHIYLSLYVQYMCIILCLIILDCTDLSGVWWFMKICWYLISKHTTIGLCKLKPFYRVIKVTKMVKTTQNALCSWTRRGMVLTQRPVEALQIFTDSELKDINLGRHRHRTPSKK
jgi:hypothetical protein